MEPMNEENERLLRDIDFSNIKFFENIDRVTLARLLPNFERLSVKSGEIIYKAGDQGDAFYIIIDGIVRVFAHPDGKLLEIDCLGNGQWFGEMALLTQEPRTNAIEAQTDLDLLKLSRENFTRIIKKYPSLGINLASLLASKLTLTNLAARESTQGTCVEQITRTDFYKKAARLKDAAPVKKAAPRPPIRVRFSTAVHKWIRDRRYISIALTVIICALAGFFFKETNLSRQQIILIELLIGAMILWSTKAFSFHTVSIALPVAAVLLATTAPATAFSGFSSSTWFLVLAVFALSAAISKTGLLYRIILLMIKRFPHNYFGQTLAIALSGVVMTPIIPSPNGRLALASPLVVMLSEILGFKKGSPGAVGFSMASLLGHGNMSIMFLNGSFVCFFMISFLPQDTGSAITWVFWFKAALIMSVVYFTGFYLLIILSYRPKEIKELISSVVDTQLKVLGPFTSEEKFCLLAVIITLAGFLTRSWHNIDGAWIALASILILFAASVLDEMTMRVNIDWPFLMSLGALIGFGNVIFASGLPQAAALAAGPYIQAFSGIRPLFLPAVAVSVLLIRFLLPAFPSIVVSMLVLLPISSTLEISPFVIGLVVLLVNEPWIFPHQSLILQTLLSSTEGRLLEPRQTLKPALYHVVISLIAVLVSFPYWRYLGLIK